MLSEPSIPHRRVRRILVDIDATLYDSDPLFIKYFRQLHDIELERIAEWDFWRGLITAEEFVVLIQKHYHSTAEIIGARPYRGAAEAINAWRAAGITVHIVSDRRPRTAAATRAWLAKIGLSYDKLVLRSPIDKIDYALRHRIDLVIDDKPATLRRAIEVGLQAATLTYPYNRGVLAEYPRIIHAARWPVLARRLVAAGLLEMPAPVADTLSVLA